MKLQACIPAVWLVSTVLASLLGRHIFVQGVVVSAEDEEPQSMNIRSPPEIASTRDARFPSVQDRVKIYMSNWYVPPCSDYQDGFFRFEYFHHNQSNAASFSNVAVVVPQQQATTLRSDNVHIESVIEPDKLFYVDRETLLDCSSESDEESHPHAGQRDVNKTISPRAQSRVQSRHNMLMYCRDAAETLLRAMDHVHWENHQVDEQNDSPLLVQFGDLDHSHVYGFVDLIHMKKFRSAASKEELDRVTSRQCYNGPRDMLRTAEGTRNFQPLVWKLATERHYGMLNNVSRMDTPWTLKLNAAIFRGQLTGSREGFDKHKSALENCLNLVRCRLVYDHDNSTLVHARLTSTRNRLPDTINGVELLTKKSPLSYLLRYKGIIMLEGNDVASGLKWSLLSQSVVLMPTPKRTSWAMEELLEPWVHYIPLNENATDVEEKMQWVLDNDETAQRIAERGSLWMQDLVFHPDAAQDERLIQEEMIRRYRAHFISK